MRELGSTARRLLALLFVVIVVAFIAGSIAMYTKAFTKVTRVSLVTDKVGYALPKDADVKTRGVLLGRVTDVKPKDGKVEVVLDLDPDLAAQIPANATARLLPKTLFGERFVELQLPRAGAAHGELRNGDVIQQDAAGNSVELDHLLDGLLPVLQAVPPQELAATLGALSQALQGNGDKLGVSAEKLGEVFDGINDEMPALESGIQDLATFTQTYNEAVPDLIASLDAMRTTSATLVEKKDDIAASIQSVMVASGELAGFLRANEQNIIDLAADSRQTLDYLARYSPSLPCAVRQFKTSIDRSDAILGVGDPHPGIRVTIEISNPRGRYVPNQDEPRNFETRGPICYPSPQPGENFPQYPHSSFADGAYQPPSRNPGPEYLPVLPDPRDADAAVTGPRQRGSVGPAPGRYVPEQFNRPLPESVTGQRNDDRVAAVAQSYAGSPLETRTVQTVYGAAQGVSPDAVPQWVAQVGAPALRGAEVTLR